MVLKSLANKEQRKHCIMESHSLGHREKCSRINRCIPGTFKLKETCCGVQNGERPQMVQSVQTPRQGGCLFPSTVCYKCSTWPFCAATNIKMYLYKCLSLGYWRKINKCIRAVSPLSDIYATGKVQKVWLYPRDLTYLYLYISCVSLLVRRSQR